MNTLQRQHVVLRRISLNVVGPLTCILLVGCSQPERSEPSTVDKDDRFVRHPHQALDVRCMGGVGRTDDTITMQFWVVNRLPERVVFLYTEPLSIREVDKEWRPKTKWFSQSLRLPDTMHVDPAPTLGVEVLDPYDDVVLEFTYSLVAGCPGLGRALEFPFITELAFAVAPSEKMVKTLQAYDGLRTWGAFFEWIMENTITVPVACPCRNMSSCEPRGQ